MAKATVTTVKAAKAAPLQAKLRVGPVNDRYEREADAVAAQVTGAGGAVSGPVPMISRLAVQRKPAEREAKESADNRRALEDLDQEELAQAKRMAPLQRKVVKAAAQLADTSGPVEETKEEVAQRDGAAGDAGFAVPAGIEAGIARQRGLGRPLPGAVRGTMEQRFGTDLSAVRVHTGPQAREAAASLDAHAFTLGQDIFFGASAYDPSSHAGRTLLAHELTHTIQQSGGTAGAQRIQRTGNGAQADAAVGQLGDDRRPSTELNIPQAGKIDASPAVKKIELPAIAIPYIEGAPKGAEVAGKGILPKPDAAAGREAIPASGGWTFKGGSERGEASAAERWRRRAATEFKDELTAALSTKIGAARDVPEVLNEAGQPIYYLRRDPSGALLLGTLEELAAHPMVLIPTWNDRGAQTFYHVDHIHELQLGGLDDWDNFWLLKDQENTSSGSTINSRLNSSIEAFLTRIPGDFWQREGVTTKPPNAEAVRRGGWTIQFADISKTATLGTYWTQQAIESGKHLEQLNVLESQVLAQEGLVRGGKEPSKVNFFMKPEGGFRRVVDLTERSKPKPVNRAESGENFLRGFDLDKIEYSFLPELVGGRETGKLIGMPFRQRRRGKQILRRRGEEQVEIPVLQSTGLGWGGYLDRRGLHAAIREIEIEGASPVEIADVAISETGSIVARGFIVSDKLLFPGLRIPVTIDGNDVYVEFPIPTESLNFGPVSVTEAAVQMGINAETGLFLSGYANVAVDQIGRGSLGARVSRGDSFIEGMFAFDLSFLDPAVAKLTYNLTTDALSLSLQAGVKAGQLPGIAGGSVVATFTRDGIDVTGSLQPSGFLTGATLTVGYTREAGLSIRAENVPLPVERIPGVTGATVSLFARRDPETGEWRFGGAGSAAFLIAGVNGSVMIGVDGAVILITGSAGFAKGPAAGILNFTATNQELDADGNPVPGEALDKFRIFGRGEATIALGKVLSATAGIALNENAEIIISGAVGLPPNFEAFERRSFERDLLRVAPPEFPIWGVSVAGFGIGIFAFVDARLSFDAFVGPGMLREAGLRVDGLNLDHPEEAVVTGSAQFHVPAGAGFTLDIGGGLRARLATAELSGRVGLDGRLGIEAEANAGVNVHWTQVEGLALQAFVSAEARPKFEIGANASVRASVDLLLGELSKTWGPWRRKLGEFGPDLAVGVRFPVSWSEAEGLNLSLDNIEVTRPQLDFGAVMKDAFLELV